MTLLGLLQGFVVLGSRSPASCCTRITRPCVDHHTWGVLDRDANGPGVHIGSAKDWIDATTATDPGQHTRGSGQEAAGSSHFGSQSENGSQAGDQAGDTVAKNTHPFAGSCGRCLHDVNPVKHRNVFTDTSNDQQFVDGRPTSAANHHYDIRFDTESCVKYHCTYQMLWVD